MTKAPFHSRSKYVSDMLTVHEHKKTRYKVDGRGKHPKASYEKLDMFDAEGENVINKGKEYLKGES